MIAEANLKRYGLLLLSILTLELSAAERTVVPSFNDELKRCADRMAVLTSMVQQQHVTVISDQGWRRQSQRRLYWKRQGDEQLHMLFVVEKPLSDAGLKVLINRRGGEDPVVHVYTPDTGRARRLVGSGASNSVLGTDLTYEDAAHLQSFLSSGQTQRRADSEFDGHAVMVIETQPQLDASAYSLIRSLIDKQYCVPLRTEFYGLNGSLDKVLSSDRASIKTVEGVSLPTSTVMHNLKHQSRSEFVIIDLDINSPLKDRLFTVAEIKKSH